MKKRNKRVIEKVKARDGRCVGCGRTEDNAVLDVHHIESWGAHLTDDPDNMVTLCRICHTKWHTGDREIRLRVALHMEMILKNDWVVKGPGVSWVSDDDPFRSIISFAGNS